MKNKTILFNSFKSLSLDKNLINGLTILIGSLSIGLLAQVSVPIPFSPVPITGQTIGVVLAGSLLGSRNGTLCIVLYLMEGSLGLPVFANMKAGAHVLFGTTGGYLWSFIIAAFLMGYFKEKQFINNPFSCFVACFVATTIILLVGAFYLSFIIGDMKKGLAMGLYPFLVGDIIKSFVCASIIQGSRKIFS